jgi:hypothetical protein
MEVTVIETNKGHKSILCEDFDTDWMWKLNPEIFPGYVQQRDAKLEYELPIPIV